MDMTPEEKHDLWVSYMKIACSIIKPIYQLHIKIRERIEGIKI